jgi:hypothetical protein
MNLNIPCRIHNFLFSSTARDFDIPKAEKMLRSVSAINSSRNTFTESNLNLFFFIFNIQALEWRRQFKIDSILTDFKPSEVLTNYVSAGLVGQDKDLSPRMRKSYQLILYCFKREIFMYTFKFSLDYALWEDGHERNSSFGKEKRFCHVHRLFS